MTVDEYERSGSGGVEAGERASDERRSVSVSPFVVYQSFVSHSKLCDGTFG
jgi:hypothetical protein